MHLLLNGEGLWLLDQSLKSGGTPIVIDILLPQYVYTRHPWRWIDDDQICGRLLPQPV
jgi:hypothetical protein